MPTQSRAADGRFRRDPAILDNLLELSVHNAIDAASYLPTPRDKRPLAGDLLRGNTPPMTPFARRQAAKAMQGHDG